jgi:hypothetical protein
MSSASPPKDAEVEHGEQSGEDREMEHPDQGAGTGEFEVKEQDRWLPIANGSLVFGAFLHCPCIVAVHRVLLTPAFHGFARLWTTAHAVTSAS